MAGHSKWANIKHRKAAQDNKRAKVFTRAIKEITIAARDGGGELDTNPSLRLAVQNAKGANMPKDTIERAIKKGVGGEGANLVEITFEGYASNGIAVFIEATTDNNNRTVASVRSIFNKYGNFIEPKWMGNSMNISPLVSILSLMFWGLIWGTTGMIVSVPFTVVIIIILSEIEYTRPLAILLSEKGDINERE